MQGNAWTELYSYDAAGGMLKKRLTLARNNFYPHNVSGSLEASWEHDDEGRRTCKRGSGRDMFQPTSKATT
jgi:hypothetical protein